MLQPAKPRQEKRFQPVAKWAKSGLLVVFIFLGVVAFYAEKRHREQEISRGKALFELSCCACHGGKISGMGKVPPNLSGIFQRSRLPSGAPATDEKIRSTILLGRSNIMPSFKNALNDEQIEEIIRYLQTAGPQADACR